MNHRELHWGLGLSAGIGEDCSWEVRQDWKKQEIIQLKTECISRVI